MPLFSERITNMYYSGTPSYSAPYSYSSVSPYGSSYSASYLSPGSNYSFHSSLGGYSRTPSPSRWINSSRTYSPILSTISEKGTSSPLRINSPRRTPITRTYIPSTYTARPININTADIDVSRDKYRNKISTANPITISSRRQSPVAQRDSENVKPNTGVDSSPGPQRTTIKRDRPVVRLHTIKRKERDSPRKPIEILHIKNDNIQFPKETDFSEKPESVKWREKLADDLAFKVQREKKSIGAKLVEKFTLKDKDDDTTSSALKDIPVKEKEGLNKASNTNVQNVERRCSMDLLAEQACLLDSLIRRENLSTAPLDLSKIGINDITDTKEVDSKKRRLSGHENPLATTKSDHSLHGHVLSKDNNKNVKHSKRQSLRKCSSSGSIYKLDCISEVPNSFVAIKLASPNESSNLIKKTNTNIKPKIKTKITSTVEVSAPSSTPLKFVVEQVTIEEKPRICRKGIVFSSTLDDELETESTAMISEGQRKSLKVNKLHSEDIKFPISSVEPERKSVSKKKEGHRKSIKIKPCIESPEPEDGNFWNKIGKRETIYLVNRKQNIQENIEKNKRSMFWLPEDNDLENNNTSNDNEISVKKETSDFIDKRSDLLTLTPFVTNKQCENSNKITVPASEPSRVNISHSDSNEVNANVHSDDKKTELDISMNLFSHKQAECAKSNRNKNDKTLSRIFQQETDVSKQSSDASSLERLENIIVDPEVKKNENKKKVNNFKKPIQSPKATVKSDSIKIVPSSSSDQLLQTTKVLELNVRNDSKDNFNIPTYALDTDEINQPRAEPNAVLVDDRNLAIANTGFNMCKEESEIIKKMSYTQDCTQLEDSKQLNDKMLLDNDQERYDIGIVKTENTNIEKTLSLSSNPLLHYDSTDNKSIENNENTNIPVSKVKEKVSIKQSMEEKNTDTRNSSTKLDKQANSTSDVITQFVPTKPVKEQKAPKVLIATPRPLQKRKPQVIHSSSSTSDDESSEEDSSDSDETESSETSAELSECENNPDGRTSTGSNDSGFDSSVPASPSAFICAKKGGDASTSTASPPPETYTHDVLEKELEHSTAYDLFRKTGRFTPPARSIPRFKKYTIEDFQFIKVLGKGSFGKVMLAELRDTEYYYAVKCLKKDVVLEDDDVECTLIERKVLALGTNHPYLCHLFATFQTDSHLFFVMEYLNGGDLMFHIQQSGRFPEARARFYGAEIVSGLKFLHKRGIVYRDLKLDNILLDFNGHVRIADFGMCKLQIYLDKTADTFCGTPDYMAPEIIKGLKYNQTVDWWSFGVLLYEMLIGQSPFSGCDEDELFWSICNEMPSYPRFLSKESLSILTRLLDKDARSRLGGAECMHGDIREQDFFQPIQWERLERRELETPFKPRVRHPMDTQYFDRAFTGERPRLTAVEPQVLRSMDQEPFRGFSYTNPNATDR